jgi:preprotein translocase subunit SecA
MFRFLSKLFDSNEKQLKAIQSIVDEINDLEKKVNRLSDEKLKEKTLEFRKKLKVDMENARTQEDILIDVSKENKKADLEKRKGELRTILPEAFAIVREAANRTAKHRHFDVQLIAGYFLFENKIVELSTGEGKTLAANLPLYMYALTGQGAHVVTVNDYLARRDAEWNGHVFNALGITVGVINSGIQYRFIDDEEAIKLKGKEGKKLIEERDKKVKEFGRMKYDHMTGVNLLECTKHEAYACDIVYGTNNEFGFDYLRDNMSRSFEERVQGPLHYAIVDEADSILIDEARTPLIISQGAEDSNVMYKQFARLVEQLQAERDYVVDEKAHAVSLNDDGIDRIENILQRKNVYEDAGFAYHIENALKAKELYKKDDEYIVRNGEVLIVDEFTGRVLHGRRYSEGLHQAIEAKEGVEIQKESKTLATITLQNYFRLYDYLAGMTGTALTEAEEFSKIYKLDTVVVPPNKPLIRKDEADRVFRTQMGKFQAIVEDIKEHNDKGQPILVGTTSVEKSEIISEMLSKEGIKHNVLNAKYHESEAKIVAEAGQKEQVTIATNMAGRGTDIGLGEGVKELGGLFIIGSERHESRRIDNQLRGRAGRQGDPGKSRFYVSFDDELMRLFGGDNVKAIMGKVGMDDSVPVSLSVLGRTIESAQKKVEGRNYDIRKRLVEFDDVLNQQREIVYGLRRRILYIIESIKNQKEAKFDKKHIKNIDVQNVREDLNRFSLKEESTWDSASLREYPLVNNPLSLWVLKRVLDHINFIIASQLVDDMKIDNVEERKTVAQIKAMLTEELIEIACKALGYKDSTEFFRKTATGKESEKQLNQYSLLAIVGFIHHIYYIGPKATSEFSRFLVLQTIDQFWMEHLDAMTDLREGIYLRNIAQKDPLVEYKNEGFRMFDDMLANIDRSIVTRFFKIRVVRKEERPTEHLDAFKKEIESYGAMKKETNESRRPATVKKTVKIGRNDPCPCKSGKKYKKCCYPKYG